MAPPILAKTIKKKKKTAKKYSVEILKKALYDIRENGKTIRETCRVYGIPRSTLQDRIAGRRTDTVATKGPDPILGLEGEKQVKDWLLNIAKSGFPIKKQELLDTVQKIVKDRGTPNPFKDNRPGQSWYLSFLKRHPELSYRNAEGISKARARVTEDSIRTWFQELKSFLRDSDNEDILECPGRIFNGDETGFSLCPKTGKVLAPRGYRNLYQVNASNEKDNITVLITFNANAQMSPPLVVFPYIRPPRALIEGMPEEWVLGRSESGWMRSDVFFEYITNDFNSWLDRNGIKKPILLLVDGHRSHMSLVLSTMCEKLGIILYALPPNTTHMLQPADVSVFGPLKSSWTTILRKFLAKPENINSSVTKTNFCQLLKSTLEETKMTENIKSGYRKCGLYPFDPDAVDYTKCIQNKQQYIQNGLTDTENITDADLITTKKVLKHMRPILRDKKIKIGPILKELHKLKSSTSGCEIDSEGYITSVNSSFNKSTSFQTENSTHISITDPSLPILTISNGDSSRSSTNDEIRAKSHDITVTAEIHPVPQSISRRATVTDPCMPTLNDVSNILSCNADMNNIEEITSDNVNSGPYAISVTADIEQLCHEMTYSEMAVFATVDGDDNLSALSGTGVGTGIGSLISLNDDNALITLDADSCLMSRDDAKVIPTQRAIASEIDAFSKHLFIPEPPQQEKPKQIKTPAAISSRAWRKYYENKENIKVEKQAVALKRKQEKLEIANQKKMKKDLQKTRTRRGKSKKNIKKDTPKEICTECDDTLFSDAEDDAEKNLGCDFCPRWFHLKCTYFYESSYIDVMNKPFKCNVCIANTKY